jgi:hypothetical protein
VRRRKPWAAPSANRVRTDSSLWSERGYFAPALRFSAPSFAPCQVVEALPGGVIQQPLGKAEHVVYRPTDPQVATRAAEIASQWVRSEPGEKPRPYPFGKVAKASSQIARKGAEMNEGALRRLEQNSRQGDSLLPNLPENGAFCSEIVSAALQTAELERHRGHVAAGEPSEFDPIVTRRAPTAPRP